MTFGKHDAKSARRATEWMNGSVNLCSLLSITTDSHSYLLYQRIFLQNWNHSNSRVPNLVLATQVHIYQTSRKGQLGFSVLP